jgi:hypothetical protein
MGLRFVARVLCTPVVLVIGLSHAGAAPCITQAVSSDAIIQFKANPNALIALNSDTRTIETAVRDLAGTDASLAPELVNLAHGAIPRNQTAIAAGLAQAAIACTNVDPQAGLLIQQAVAAFQDGQFQAAFEAVAGDLSTAATDAAASSAASSVGSVIIVNPNAGGKAATNLGGGGNLAILQITSNVAPANAAARTASTSTGAANSVSPAQ